MKRVGSPPLGKGVTKFSKYTGDGKGWLNKLARKVAVEQAVSHWKFSRDLRQFLLSRLQGGVQLSLLSR